nr:DNA-directed RNA polymerase I subunit RPA12-like [Ipomoea batatas]
MSFFSPILDIIGCEIRYTISAEAIRKELGISSYDDGEAEKELKQMDYNAKCKACQHLGLAYVARQNFSGKRKYWYKLQECREFVISLENGHPILAMPCSLQPGKKNLPWDCSSSGSEDSGSFGATEVVPPLLLARSIISLALSAGKSLNTITCPPKVFDKIKETSSWVCELNSDQISQSLATDPLGAPEGTKLRERPSLRSPKEPFSFKYWLRRLQVWEKLDLWPENLP